MTRNDPGIRVLHRWPGFDKHLTFWHCGHRFVLEGSSQETASKLILVLAIRLGSIRYIFPILCHSYHWIAQDFRLVSTVEEIASFKRSQLRAFSASSVLSFERSQLRAFSASSVLSFKRSHIWMSAQLAISSTVHS